jgi:hypothetical protein
VRIIINVILCCTDTVADGFGLQGFERALATATAANGVTAQGGSDGNDAAEGS